VLDYDREAPRYDASRGGDARADAAAGAIETLISAGLAVGEAAGLAVGQTRIADVGCGTGIVTWRLARAGRSVIGIDRSAGMAAVAAGRLPGRITLGNVTRIPLGDRSVDVVTMVWLLHLLRAQDAAAAVAEAGRVLRPGGLLITTVGKNDAAFGGADDAAAIVGPVRARFDSGQTDRLDLAHAAAGGRDAVDGGRGPGADRRGARGTGEAARSGSRSAGSGLPARRAAQALTSLNRRGGPRRLPGPGGAGPR